MVNGVDMLPFSWCRVCTQRRTVVRIVHRHRTADQEAYGDWHLRL